MATRLVPYYCEVTDYDQAGEEALAITLEGVGAWSVIIFNTDAGKTRIWNGTGFENAPMKNPDGGTYSNGGNPDWVNVQNKPSVFPPESHSHGYEPANSNIQAHISSTHAPTDAQKNSDITKGEIEAKLTGEITSHTHPAGGGGIQDNPEFLGYQALGSPLKAQTLGLSIQQANTSSNLTDGQIRWVAVYLPKAATITGVRVYIRVQGAYTGDNNNKVGLYSYSGGTLTQVAESTNSSTLWTSAANAFQAIAFTTPYSAQPGVYFVALIYNNSAQTTAPALGVGTALNNAAMGQLAFANSAKLYGTSNATNLPASIASSAITASTVLTWVALY